jgi:hypothetical protein
MNRMGQQQSQARSNTMQPTTMQPAPPHQQPQQPQQQSQSGHLELGNKQGSITSLAAHHAAQKLAAQIGQQQQGDVKASTSTKSSPYTSRSNSFSQQGPFEGQTQIKADTQPAAASGAGPSFPARPVSSRGHMLPQSAQMISEKERQREAEMEHIFAPQPGQIIAERCQSTHALTQASRIRMNIA